jgi:hypothetical protein
MVLKNGSKGEGVVSLQRALKVLGFNCGVADGIFGKATEIQVEKFQVNFDLLPDGIVGEQTLQCINSALESAGESEPRFIIEVNPDPDETFEKNNWVRVDADQAPGSKGYNRFNLRSDAAEAYNAFRSDVLALGGIVTSSGAKRSLQDSSRSKSRSTKSLHYTGLAFDMALDSGMNDPKKERYVVEQIGERNWNVWCKTDNLKVPIRTVLGYTYFHTKVPIEGRMFSITEIAEKHGFKPIRARGWFMRGGKYTGAEWWHFQFESALTPGVSTFGGELLKLYTMAECRQFEHWDASKNCVWKENWF